MAPSTRSGGYLGDEEMGKQVTHFPTLAIYGPVPGAGRSGDLWTRAGGERSQDGS